MPHHGDYSRFETTTRKEMLDTLLISYDALAVDNWVANMANAASLLWYGYHSLADKGKAVNWAGFYVINEKKPAQLILGPFQGSVACQDIKIGKGVCGTAAHTKKTQLVPDVEKFPGHIACDSLTKSEIVVPILDRNGEIRGVIDLDCEELEGFGQEDVEYLEKLAKRLGETCF